MHKCMDWRAINFDWNRAKAFFVTAEEGSLSAAARSLGTTQPTIGRQVAALEKELGVALFERVSRGLEVTPNGLELLEYVRVMAEAANSLSLTASGRADALEGSVCITATEVMAIYVLPPIIEKFRRLEPGIKIELIASNSTSDLRRREADIAIRGFRPTQPDLIAKRLCGVTANLYATPEYLAKLDNPVFPHEVCLSQFIGFENTKEFIAALKEKGINIEGEVSLKSDNRILQWELCKLGLGISVMEQEVGDAEPKVVRAIEHFKPFRGDLWLVAHRELRTSRRIRRVFELLAKELGDH